MKRYILTGTPGAGKTSVLHALKDQGYTVIEEAATDVIAIEHAHGNFEAWRQPDFIDKIVHLQQQRQTESQPSANDIQIYDRSPICTLALARHLGYAPSDELLAELERIERENIYQRQVFFLENLGFVEPTEARQISFEDALRFVKIHEETYNEFGYQLIHIPPEPLPQRVQRIIEWIGR